jgi:hypothetical protein
MPLGSEHATWLVEARRCSEQACSAISATNCSKGSKVFCKPLSGKPLEGLMPVPNHQFSCRGIYTDINVLSSQGLFHIVTHVIKQHAAIGTHFPYEVLPINMMQPSVRIDNSRPSRQRRQVRKGDTRRLIATRKRLIRAFMVVVLHKGSGGFSYLFLRSGESGRANILA